MQSAEKSKTPNSSDLDILRGPSSLDDTEVASISLFSRGYGFIVFVLMLIVISTFSLMLFTYHPQDSGFSHVSNVDHYENLFGVHGAWVADLVYLLLGWSAWFVVVGAIYILGRNWKRLRGRLVGETSIPFGLRIISFCLLIVSSSSFFFLCFHSHAPNLPATSGGMIGSTFGTMVISLMGMTLASITTFLLSALLASVFFGFSWLGVLAGMVNLIEKIYLKIRQHKEHKQDEKVGQEAQIERRKKREENSLKISNITAEENNLQKNTTTIVRELDKAPIPYALEPKAKPIGVSEQIPLGIETEEPKGLPIDEPEIENYSGTEEQGIPGCTLYAKSGDQFELPSTALLDDPPYERPQVSAEELQETSLRIESILNTYHLKSKVLSALPGPVVTQFRVQPSEGISGNRYQKVAKDLARCLGKLDVRVVENLMEANCIGLEIPNGLKQTIFLKEIINSNKFQEQSSKLILSLGKDIAGYPEVTDLAKAPHLLVAGTTGSGKSVGINAMILSMLYRCTPEELRLVLVDPKEVEFAPYEGIPHLLTPVITDMMKAVHALKWCVKEMDRRYGLMKRVGVKKIDLLNEKIEEERAKGGFIPNPFSLTPENPEPLKKLPYIVIIIDELADLLLTNGKQVEPQIMRLTQKARAAGMHLIMATQRPSTDIVTPIIKTNCPTRISFQVSNRYDSQTILGDSGAENLLGHGDMLFMSPGRPFRRIHGANVTDYEIQRVTDFLKSQGEPEYVDGVTEEQEVEMGENPINPSGGEKDSLYDKAVQIVLTERKCSISYLQRRLGVGYNRAANLVETMEASGLVSSPTATGKREVLGPSYE